MKKILSIFVISLLIGLNASAEIIDLKCTWNSGYAVPNEDMSLNKGRVEFFKIDLEKKIVLDSPSGGYKNKTTNLSKTWVYINDNRISFGIDAGNGSRRSSYRIDRNTGELKQQTTFNADQLKGMVVNKYLCEKTKIKQN